MTAPLLRLHLEPLARTVFHWCPWRMEVDEVDHFDLNAPYQRGSVWTLDQRRALIKSLLMGLPVGSVITSAMPYQSAVSYRVIDGKQRVETIRGFWTGEFTVPGWWFHPADCEHRDRDVTCADLTDRGRRGFEHAGLPELHWNSRIQDPDLLLRAEAEVYLLVNGAGTGQTDEDMARAARIAGGES